LLSTLAIYYYCDLTAAIDCFSQQGKAFIIAIKNSTLTDKIDLY